MKNLLVSLALATLATVAFAQNPQKDCPKGCPKKADCPKASKACPKAGKTEADCPKGCTQKAECPKGKKG